MFVNGRDVAEADGVCTNPDVLGNPDEYRAGLRITLQHVDPSTRTWKPFRDTMCQQDSALGQNVFVQCTLVHQYLDKNDPIQTHVRRAKFEIGPIVNGALEVRSTRYFGPFADRIALELVDPLLDSIQ